jgi:hypothetical protein
MADYNNTSTTDFNRSCSHLTDVEIAYSTLTSIASALSMAGSSGILATYCMHPDVRTAMRKQLLHLSAADFVTALGNLLGIAWFVVHRTCVPHPHTELACQLHSAMTIFSSIASFLWNVVMATSLYISIVRNDPTFAARYNQLLYAACWGIPGKNIPCILRPYIIHRYHTSSIDLDHISPSTIH